MECDSTFCQPKMGLLIESTDRKKVEIYSGPYSCFAAFRKWVASKCGYKLYPYVYTLWGMYISLNQHELLTREIHEIKANPAHNAFFQHSDSDGAWTKKECRLIANMLSGILSTLAVENQDETKETAEPSEPASKKPRIEADSEESSHRHVLKNMIKGLEHVVRCKNSNIKGKRRPIQARFC